MRNLSDAITAYFPVDNEAIAYLSALMQPQYVQKNKKIEVAGIPSPGYIFVQSGCLMTYYTDAELHIFPIQFSMDGWWTGDLESLTQHTASSYHTVALMDSHCLLLHKADFDRLLLHYPVFERYFRIIYQNSLITHQKRIILNHVMEAEDRYLYFKKKYPSLEQIVPQKYIAGYLGITPEFLSKIRRRQMEREKS